MIQFFASALEPSESPLRMPGIPNIFCPIFLPNTVHAQIDAVYAGLACKLTPLCCVFRPEWLGWLAGRAPMGVIQADPNALCLVVFSEGRKLRNRFLKSKAKTDSIPIENSLLQASCKTTTPLPPTGVIQAGPNAL